MNDIVQFVTEKNGQPITTSRNVAERFGKEHAEVLKKIHGYDRNGRHVNGIINDFDPSVNTLQYFIQNKYKDSSGKTNIEYIMTRDGFSLLVMGFTGKRALEWKVKYIEAFNKMESFIKSLQQAKLEFPAFTNAIMDAHEEPKHYHFSNEINMINRIVLGMTASQFKEANGIDKKVPSIRPHLALEQIQKIEELQRVDIGLIVSNMDYEVRKSILENHFKRRYLVA